VFIDATAGASTKTNILFLSRVYTCIPNTTKLHSDSNRPRKSQHSVLFVDNRYFKETHPGIWIQNTKVYDGDI